MPALKILVVEDEFALRSVLESSLAARGYAVLTAPNGNAGLELMRTQQPALVLLDLGLPDLDGVEVIRRVREWTQTPIIILSARHDDAEKVQALDAGADDYLTKPFSTDELLARLRVAQRHLTQQAQEAPIITCGQLQIDLARRLVQRGNKDLHLTPTEYQLLRLLALNQGRVLTHSALLREGWGPGYAGDTQLLRGFIAQIRQKIEPEPRQPRYLLTEPGIGYRLAEQAD